MRAFERVIAPNRQKIQILDVCPRKVTVHKFVANKSRERIHSIVTHHRPHQDELMAIWLLRMFGGSKFSGVSESNIVFRKGELEKEEAGCLYIGLGHGQFDEHRPNGRLPDTCAALLVAREIFCPPNVSDLLGEVLWADTHDGIKETQLASVIKAMHCVKKAGDQIGTYRFAGAAFYAICYGVRDHSFDLRKEWNEYLDTRRLSSGEPAVKAAGRFVHESFMRRKEFVTELSAIAAKMDKEIVQAWLADAFDCLIRFQGEFLVALNDVRFKSSSVDIQVYHGGIEPAYFIKSDSELVNKAANSFAGGKAAVTVVIKSTGHMQVYADKQRQMSLFDFVAMVRMAEYKVRTGKTLTFEKARGMGTIKECPVWHQPNPHQVLNSSLTHPDIEPTVLKQADMQEIAEHAFNRSGREIWIERYFGEDESSSSSRVIDLGGVLDGKK